MTSVIRQKSHLSAAMNKLRMALIKSMPTARADRISQFFQFEQLGTNYRTELLTSLTTFMTLAPILVVNAHLLGNAVFLNQPGDLFGQILVAIALCSAVSSIAIGLLANYPIVLTPGTGTVALFAFSIVLGMGMNWRLAFTAVLVEGILFTALSISPLRHSLNDAIPSSLKQAMVVGIGLFLSYIALSGKVTPPTLGTGIIVASTATTTSLGSLKQPATLIGIVGILLTTLLTVRRVKGALLLGIFGTAILGWLWGVAPLPQGILTLPKLPVDLIGQSIAGVQYLNGAQLGNFVAAVFILLFVSLSDILNSLNVLGHQLNRIHSDGELHRSKQAFLSNTLGAVFGAWVGCVPVLPHVASASGIFEGGEVGWWRLGSHVYFYSRSYLLPYLQPFLPLPLLRC